MAGEPSDVTQVTETEELDALSGEELFEIPDDLKDVPDYGAPAPDEGTDAADAAPPAAKPGATQPRDKETGQFEEKPEDAPAARAGQPPVEPQAGKAPAEKPATTEAAAQGDEEEEPEFEFSFRADGNVIPIKGSKITKDYVMLPRAHMAEYQRLLSNGVVYRGSYRQRLDQSARDLAETKAEIQEDVVRARAVLEFIGKKMDEGPDALLEWAEDFDKNRAKLEADATLAVARAHQEKKPVGDVRAPGFEDDQADTLAASIDVEELQNTLSADLTSFVPAALKELGIRGLTGQEIQGLIAEMVDPEELDRFFGLAGEDMPEYGVTKGQLVRKDAVIAKTLKRRSELILGARKSATDLEAAKNKNNRTGNPIPPTTTATGGAPGKKKAKALPKTREELDAWMDDDEDEV